MRIETSMEHNRKTRIQLLLEACLYLQTETNISSAKRKEIEKYKFINLWYALKQIYQKKILIFVCTAMGIMIGTYGNGASHCFLESIASPSRNQWRHSSGG